MDERSSQPPPDPESGWARPSEEPYGQSPNPQPYPDQPAHSEQPVYQPYPAQPYSDQPAYQAYPDQPAQQPDEDQPPYEPYAGQYSGYQPYGQPGVPPPGSRRTNGLAVAALVTSLVGLVTGIAAPVGAVLGHIAARQIAQTGDEGASMARAAIWIGWVITGLYLVACCALISLVIAAGQAGGWR